MNDTLDIKRVKKLLVIGIFGTILGIVADFIFGFNKYDASLTSSAKRFSLYENVSDARFIAGNVLGIIGVILQTLCLFSIFRLINDKDKKLAHIYRSGIILLTVVGPFGGHSLFISMFYVYKKIYELSGREVALEVATSYMMAFLLVALILYIIAALIIVISQVVAIIKKRTILPKYNAIYSIARGLILTLIFMCINVNNEFINAMMVSGLNFGFLIMYVGILINVIKYERRVNVQIKY